MPEPISATVATVGSSLLGSKLAADAQSDASKRAANIQRDAMQQQLALQERMYEQAREDYTPYRNLGSFAAGRLASRLGMPTDYGYEATGLADSDTMYMTPQGLATVPIGSTLLGTSGLEGTTGARTPTGQFISLGNATKLDPSKVNSAALSIAKGNPRGSNSAQAFLAKFGIQ